MPPKDGSKRGGARGGPVRDGKDPRLPRLEVKELNVGILPGSERDLLLKPVASGADANASSKKVNVAVPEAVSRMRELSAALRGELDLIRSGRAPMGSPVRGASISNGGGGAFPEISTDQQQQQQQQPPREALDGLQISSDQPMTTTEIRKRHIALLRVHEQLNEEHLALKTELQTRQDSYLRREARLRQNVDTLRTQVERMVTARGDPDGPMRMLRRTINDIQSGMDTVTVRAGKIVQAHKSEVEHIARTKLGAMQRELDAMRARSDNVEFEWLEKCAALERKLDWTNEQAVRLNAKNEYLAKQNATLQREYSAQKESIGQLHQQLHAARRECDRLREFFAQAQEADEHDPDHPGGHVADGDGAFAGGRSAQGADEQELRRVKAALAKERQAARALRSDNAALLNSRTELEVFLRRAVDAVKEDILREKRGFVEETFAEAASGLSRTPRARAAAEVGLEEFGGGDRDKVLEILLSKERVLTLLYGRIFGPIDGQDSLATTAGAGSAPRNGAKKKRSPALDVVRETDGNDDGDDDGDGEEGF